MESAPGAFLVTRREDGYGEVHRLAAGVRCTLGRSPTSQIVLKDDLCSREHAEVFGEADGWFVRDKNSTNGTRLNGRPLDKGQHPIGPLDEVQVGRSKFVFVTDLKDLPQGSLTAAPQRPEKLAIRKRMAETRYLPALNEEPPAGGPDGETVALGKRPDAEQALSRLYRLAVEMATADSPKGLAEIVLDGLLKSIPADVGGVLQLKKNRDLELITYRHRDPSVTTYHKVSQFVSQEVLTGRQAILAEDVLADTSLSKRESLADLEVTGLICAPVTHEDKTLGLIHLYSTSAREPLNQDDVEFALAMARQLGMAWRQANQRERLSRENKELKSQLRRQSELVGSSNALRAVQEQARRVAETQATVLVRGESGSGKELVARLIHAASPRRDQTLICLNCAAMTESLLESELFGHEKGAFTGATERMAGKFEAADRGTLFLDEIGEMTLATQAKLLRVLEGHPFERVGGNTPIKVDVRVVAATNRPLEEMVREGKFRRDLFYRLQVVEINLPPLRDRLEDVPSLAGHFLQMFVRETGRRIDGFTAAAMKKMQGYHWPGNVRELRNVVERAVALSGGGGELDASDIWLSPLDIDEPAAPAEYEPVPLSEVEKRHIEQTLRHTDWNKSQASTILGIERSTLDRKIERHGIRR